MNVCTFHVVTLRGGFCSRNFAHRLRRWWPRCANARAYVPVSCDCCEVVTPEQTPICAQLTMFRAANGLRRIVVSPDIGDWSTI